MNPFLFGYARERTGAEDIPGRYSEESSMWVVEESGRMVALIDTGSEFNEITTKTEGRVEADDQVKRSILEMETKTFTVTEQDDQRKYFKALAEVTTKTRVELESDDTKKSSGEMFL